MNNMTATLHFAELLSALLKGKTSLADALFILTREGIEKPVQDTAAAVLSTMKKGKGLSESLRTIRKTKVFFEPLYLTLISAAELTGSIENVLDRIVLDIKRKQKAKENVVNIMIYPSIIIFLAVAGTMVMIIKIIPFFISGGLVSNDVLSEAMIGAGIAGIILLAGGSALFIFYFKIFFFDSPEFRIFYLLDVLLCSNITLPEALSQCIMSMIGTKYGRALIILKKDIVSGIAFPAAFSKIHHFPSYAAGWLSIAHMNGNISEACGNIKDYFAQKDDKIRVKASRLIEPSVIILTGIYILIVMTTVILPILTSIGGII